MCQHAALATTCQSRPQTTGLCRGPVRSESAHLATPLHHSEKLLDLQSIEISKALASERQIHFLFLGSAKRAGMYFQ